MRVFYLFVLRRYDDIINCMEGIIADCQLDEAIQLEHAQAILRDHVQGFGKLCDEDQAFFNGTFIPQSGQIIDRKLTKTCRWTYVYLHTQHK